jgi:hypothetical protein
MNPTNPTTNNLIDALVDTVCQVVRDKYKDHCGDTPDEADKRELDAVIAAAHLVGALGKSLIEAGPALTRIADALDKNNALMHQAVNPQIQVNQ